MCDQATDEDLVNPLKAVTDKTGSPWKNYSTH